LNGTGIIIRLFYDFKILNEINELVGRIKIHLSFFNGSLNINKIRGGGC